jgi:peroxiredoxin
MLNRNTTTLTFFIALFLTVGLVACEESGSATAESKPEAAKPAAAKAEAKSEPAKAAAAAPALPKGTVEAKKAKVGEPAPTFSLPGLDGKLVDLKSYQGKTVVLEWFNPDCPFVKYAYGDGPLKTMAKEQVAKGVVWLSINSGAKGKQGHGVERNKKAKEEYQMASTILLDEEGIVGKAYGARTTPHMYIVDKNGVLAYAGALDNAPVGEPKEGALVKHLEVALDEAMAGKPVALAETSPYGCSVKYP